MTAEKLNDEKKYRILAVDDEEEALKLYSVFLKHQGYEVATASDATDCMYELNEEKPDIILLDVNMPEIDGLKLLEMIRASDSGRNVPIIMVSARRDEKTIKAAAELGCDNFIIKPFDLKEMAKRISFELVEVRIEFVRNSLLSLRMANNSLFAKAGLTDFNKSSFDCYPFSHNGAEYCVVVALGMRPQALYKATEAELEEKIRIFFRHPLRWRQVWPK